MTDVHCHVSCGDAAIREFLIGRDFVGLHPWETLDPAVESSKCPISSAVGCRLSAVLPRSRSRGEGQPTGDSRQTGATNDEATNALRVRLAAEPALGVGEIGLDRLKERTVSPQMREVFLAQLALAAEFRRPVVLHGAKCWGQVVAEIKRLLAGTQMANEKSSVFVQRQRTLDEDVTTFDFDGRAANNRTSPSFLFHGFSRSDGLLPDIVALNGFVSVGPAVLNEHAVNYRELVKKIPLDRLVVETDRTPENAATCPSVVEVAKKVAELRGMSFEELEKITDANAKRFARVPRCGYGVVPKPSPTLRQCPKIPPPANSVAQKRLKYDIIIEHFE